MVGGAFGGGTAPGTEAGGTGAVATGAGCPAGAMVAEAGGGDQAHAACVDPAMTDIPPPRSTATRKVVTVSLYPDEAGTQIEARRASR